MKRILAAFLVASSLSSVYAQEAYTNYGLGSNWSIGVDGGVTTPIKGHSFLKNMRGAFGLHLQKGITPAFAIGFEATAGVNTTTWESLNLHNNIGEDLLVKGHSKTMIDNTYVGAYGALNLFNLFAGMPANGYRVFDMELVAGAGWGHNYYSYGTFAPEALGVRDQNYFMTKAGLNFNFNINRTISLSLKPSVAFNMSGTQISPLDIDYTTAGYNAHKAYFNCLVGVNFRIGKQLERITPGDPALIDGLNAQINQLRGELDAVNASSAANLARQQALANELAACQSSKNQVKEAVASNANTVRYVLYGFSSSKIPANQIPTVEMTADFLKKNPNARVVIDGYASPEGNLSFNQRLAAARAESVKKMLINKYGISADRITAQGKGISEMFDKRVWNRVAICTIED